MRMVVLALAVAAAPAVALPCDSPSDSNSPTFILRDGDTTRLIGSIEDLQRIKSKLRGHGPALFVRLDGKEYVIVLRGWIEADARREHLPSVVTPRGEHRIDGIALEKVPQYMEQQRPDACRPGPTPCVWQNLRTETFAAWSGLAVQPVVVEQTNALGDGLVREWERPEATFLKNEMYALQWYSLAALCVILFLALSFRREPIPSR